MSSDIRAWLSEALEQRGWSQSELARRAGVSQFAVSSVIAGDRNAGADFCVKIAQALGEPPEKLLRMANILPSLPASDNDPTLAELRDLIENLPPGQRKEALRYLRYLYQTDQGEK